MRRALPMIAVLLLVACGACSHDQRPEGEEHAKADQRGRAGGGHAVEKHPTLAVTKYESGVELFIEYPAFVAGEESPLVAHFTDARDPNAFHPVTAGAVTATLRYADGAEERFSTAAPLRDGVFTPVVKPTRAGAATLGLALHGPQAAGTVEVGGVVVHPTLAAARTAPAPGDAEPTVAFLKEQQWKTEYATVAAERRELQASVPATGELKPVAGRSAELSSPVDGRIAVGATVPYVGQRVHAGDVLLTVTPTMIAAERDLPSLEAAAANARTQLGVADRELARARKLVELRAIPEKQLDAARAARETAAASLRAAERQLAAFRGVQSAAAGESAAGSFQIRAPLDGVVSFADVRPGAVITPGTRLVTIVNVDRLWLEVRVYEQDAGRVEHTPGAEFTVTGADGTFTVDETNGRRVAVGAVIDPATRTVPVVFELANPGGLKPGMYAKVSVRTGAAVTGVAIPESAVVDDDGVPTVFIVKTGETFAKRRVRLGERSKSWVRVVDGVREGERIVSRGAYEIKLATAGAIPARGHQH